MLFSIITINYNNKKGLQKTIESVISQTCRAFEWIIIDGGSSDGSKELIERYQDQIVYWCSESDKGIYNAMNKGIAHAEGDYLIFMNSGDCFYEPSTLEKVSHTVLADDIIYGDAMRMNEESEVIWHSPHHIEKGFFYSGNICHQAMFIRTSLLKEEGYDESYELYGDRARWLKIANDGGTFNHIPIIVCSYEMGGRSGNLQKGMIEYRKVINTFPISPCFEKILLKYKTDCYLIGVVKRRSLRKGMLLLDKIIKKQLINIYLLLNLCHHKNSND